jgi:DNA-binding PadR family transcriptional regulator
MIRWVVLRLLRSGERLHGYALVKAHRDLTGTHLNSGNFYRELRRLAGEGFVRTAAKDSETADARRTQYQITQAGLEEFDDWFALHTDYPSGQGEDELSLRTLFVSKVEPDLGRRLLERWRDDLWLRSQVLEREREAEIVRRGKARNAPFCVRAGLLGRRLRHLAADLDFLDELRRQLEADGVSKLGAGTSRASRRHGGRESRRR